MNFKLLGNLSLFGALFGAMSSFGFLKDYEWVGWLLFLVLSTVIITRTLKDQIFLHSVFCGFIFALLFYAVQIVLMATYLQTHPDFISQVRDLSKDITPQTFMIFSGMIFSTVYGLFTGLFAIGLSKFFVKSAPKVQVTQPENTELK